MNQQYLYIVQWGKNRSICSIYQKGTQLHNEVFIVDNQEIANFHDLGIVIN